MKIKMFDPAVNAYRFVTREQAEKLIESAKAVEKLLAKKEKKDE